MKHELNNLLNDQSGIFRSIIDATADGIFIFDQNDHFIFYHFPQNNLIMKTEEALLNHSYQEILPQNLQEALQRGLTTTQRGEIAVYDYPLIINKQTVWFNTSFTPIIDQEKYLGSIIVLRDITHQKHAEETNKLLARFPDDNPQPVLRIDNIGMVHYANNSGLTLLDHLDISCYEKIPDQFLIQIQQILVSEDQEFELPLKDYIYSITVMPIETTPFIYIYGKDITKRRRTEEKLQLSNIVFNSTIEGIILTDPHGLIQSVNPAFTTITGYSIEDIIGQTPKILKSHKHPDSFYKEIWNSLLLDGVWSGEIWNRRKDGTIYPEWLSINSILNKQNKIKYYLAVFNDITKLKQKEEEAQYHSYHDTLTNLPNRKLLQDRLSVAINQAKRSELEIGVIFIDLDHFKTINDSLGYTVGDILLQHVAKLLKTCIRAGDTLARIGGDEFVIIATNIAEMTEILNIVNRIRDLFITPQLIMEHELFITPSIGISIFPSDGDTAEQLLKNADLAMDYAKQKERNSYQFYSKKMDHQARQRLELENRLRYAIKQNHFVLYYQPIIEVKTRKIVSAEALVRWKDPNIGIISPGEFIPLAEETGLIVPLDAWVLRTACIQNKAWQDEGLNPITISVNVTAQEFQRPELVDEIRDILNKTSLDPKYLVLEITENNIMQKRDQITEMMSLLKGLGVSISIDDFGTGYSSLSYLKRFPLDNLKIDRSFVIDLPYDSESVSIAQAIIALTQSLNLNVIAEGVETNEQLQFLEDNNCSKIQGYYFSRPLPEDDFKILLKKGFIE